MFYFFPFFTALILALVFTPSVKFLAQNLKIVDLPAPRKIHQKPVPLLGGLAVFLAFSLTVIIFWRLGEIADAKISDAYILAILLGGLILMIGGFLDDWLNLKPWQQLIFPLLAILLILTAGIKITCISSPFGGILAIPAEFGVLTAFFWLLGLVYTTKVLDGLDGLVSGITVIGSLIIFIVSLSWDVPSSGTSVLALILAGAGSGFLFFNWQPAKIFLGEGGSVFCGFILGTLAIISGSKIATALLIMGIPILDVFWVISRRLWQGKSPASADNKHLHFRLLDLGLSHRQAVIFLYAVTAAFGLASLFLSSPGKLAALAVLVLFMLVLAGILVVKYKLNKVN